MFCSWNPKFIGLHPYSNRPLLLFLSQPATHREHSTTPAKMYPNEKDEHIPLHQPERCGAQLTPSTMTSWLKIKTPSSLQALRRLQFDRINGRLESPRGCLKTKTPEMHRISGDKPCYPELLVEIPQQPNPEEPRTQSGPGILNGVPTDPPTPYKRRFHDWQFKVPIVIG